MSIAEPIPSTAPFQECEPSRPHEYSAAEIGALAHLYRGEVYRSTVWRTRLNNTTYAKLAIHPTAMQSLADLWERAAIGPVPGQLVVLVGIAFHGTWVTFMIYTMDPERKRQHCRQSPIAMG